MAGLEGEVDSDVSHFITYRRRHRLVFMSTSFEGVVNKAGHLSRFNRAQDPGLLL